MLVYIDSLQMNQTLAYFLSRAQFVNHIRRCFFNTHFHTNVPSAKRLFISPLSTFQVFRLKFVKKDRQFMYKVILRYVHTTTVVVKSNKYFIS